MEAGLAEPVHRARQVRDLEGDPVPSAGCRQSAVGHGLPSARSTTGCAEQEPKVAARHNGEGRSWVHLYLEAEVPAVEGERGVDIVDDVADAHGGHVEASCSELGQR